MRPRIAPWLSISSQEMSDKTRQIKMVMFTQTVVRKLERSLEHTATATAALSAMNKARRCLERSVSVWALCVCACTLVLAAHSHNSPPPTPHPHEHAPLPYPPGHDDNDLPRVNLGADVGHIKEDLARLGLPTDKLENLTMQEMDFYFFTLHDFDNNTKLDGNELIKAVTHTIGENIDRVKAQPNMTQERMTRHIEHIYKVMFAMVDEAMEFADTDRDGFLTWSEYVAAKHSYKESEDDAHEHEDAH